jgi:dTDP-4-dehydrorhamnose reductase
MIVITGANGLVGRAMARRFPDALALTHAELDITDASAVRALEADVILNCAVVGVEESELDPALAEAVNVRGPELLARACRRLVHFSTNYVDGVYGRTKREGERFAATVIRTSWVFGPGRDNFLSTVPRRLRDGARVRANDATRACVTYVEHLAARTAALIDRDGLFEIANDGVCSAAEFAREAARLVGADQSLIEVFSEPRNAPLLVTDPPLPHWRAALAEYIESADA